MAVAAEFNEQEQRTLFLKAAREGDIEAIKNIIKTGLETGHRVDINCLDDNGRTALMLAKDAKTVEFLLSDDLEKDYAPKDRQKINLDCLDKASFSALDRHSFMSDPTASALIKAAGGKTGREIIDAAKRRFHGQLENKR